MLDTRPRVVQGAFTVDDDERGFEALPGMRAPVETGEHGRGRQTGIRSS